MSPLPPLERMSVRRHLLAPALALSTLAGLLQFNGFRVLYEALGSRSGESAVRLANVALQLADFAVAVALPFALGYWTGTRSDLREDYLALAAVVALAAFVGYAGSVGVTLVVTDPDQVRIPALYTVPTLLTSALSFTVAVVAGAGVGYVHAVRDGTHTEVDAA